jgi:hypothetical protein
MVCGREPESDILDMSQWYTNSSFPQALRDTFCAFSGKTFSPPRHKDTKVKIRVQRARLWSTPEG